MKGIKPSPVKTGRKKPVITHGMWKPKVAEPMKGKKPSPVKGKMSLNSKVKTKVAEPMKGIKPSPVKGKKSLNLRTKILVAKLRKKRKKKQRQWIKTSEKRIRN